MEGFNEILKSSKGKLKELKNSTAIIIDDEADYASVNTSKKEEDPTTINNEIRNMIDNLNDQISKLSEMENYKEYKEKFESMTSEYDKEKERLTKLYQLYEETDSDCKKLRNENKNWLNWFDSNKEIFTKIFYNAPPVGSPNISMDETSDNVTPIDDSAKKKPKKSKKKKLRLKKQN